MAIKLTEDNISGHPVFGADPEIFVANKDGKIEPAFKFLGSKKKPSKTDYGTHGGQNLFWDGFAAEFNTVPVSCLSWHVDSVRHGLSAVRRLAQEHDKNLDLTIKNVIKIHHQTLRFGDSQYVELGCEPSYNAYGLKPHILSGREINLRSAGGHIHFGATGTSKEQKIQAVKALDLILGVSCVSLFQKYDNPDRRKYYGLPGEYRLPSHGLEYRVLSNAWLVHPFIKNMVFELARKAFYVGSRGKLDLFNYDQDQVIETITNCDVKQAHEIIEKNQELWEFIIRHFNVGVFETDKSTVKSAFECFVNGAHSVLKHPFDVSTNWDLGQNWTTHCEGKEKAIYKSIKTIRDGGKV